MGRASELLGANLTAMTPAEIEAHALRVAEYAAAQQKLLATQQQFLIVLAERVGTGIAAILKLQQACAKAAEFLSTGRAGEAKGVLDAAGEIDVPQENMAAMVFEALEPELPDELLNPKGAA